MTKGVIFDLKRFAVHDGDGIRTTVFLKGCPLRCRWCHNPEGLLAACQLAFAAHKCLSCGGCATACRAGAHRVEDGVHRFSREKCVSCGACVEACPADALKLYGKTVTPEQLPQLLEDREFYENSNGGVTLSGGECLLQPEFCRELLGLLKREGISTAVDTCGCVPWQAFEAVLPVTDVFLYDLKAVDDAVHRACTGAGNALILENLRRLDAVGAKVEIRIPVVPGFNETELPAMADFLAGLSCVTAVRLLAYHPFGGDKYNALEMPQTMPETPSPNVEQYQHLFTEKGLRVK